MPTLELVDLKTVEVEEGKRLVRAIEEAGVDIMHACGGHARCTTCRVEFVKGEPQRMTAAEKEKLGERQLEGFRLSCQILCDHDMTLKVVFRLKDTGRPDPGPTPEEGITPDPEWV